MSSSQEIIDAWAKTMIFRDLDHLLKVKLASIEVEPITKVGTFVVTLESFENIFDKGPNFRTVNDARFYLNNQLEAGVWFEYKGEFFYMTRILYETEVAVVIGMTTNDKAPPDIARLLMGH